MRLFCFLHWASQKQMWRKEGRQMLVRIYLFSLAVGVGLNEENNLIWLNSLLKVVSLNEEFYSKNAFFTIAYIYFITEHFSRLVRKSNGI